MTGLTTDDHTCVRLLDDVVLKQVLTARDGDDRAMLVRLNLAAAGAATGVGRIIAPARAVATEADRARHPSAGRHAKLAQHASEENRERSAA